MKSVWGTVQDINGDKVLVQLENDAGVLLLKNFSDLSHPPGAGDLVAVNQNDDGHFTGTVSCGFARGMSEDPELAKIFKVCEMKFFTFIMEYKGGTYLSQVQSRHLYEVLEKWATSLDIDAVEGMIALSREAILEDIKHEDEQPIAIVGLINTWSCCVQTTTADLPTEDDIALLHIVQTEKAKHIP